ncbi:hypothetical protein RHSIM_Rhsim07G0248400 [Rhododendron simsii]|uniref:Uncharacterized protein n=1 Tax=Rhododendron simsii TaxID=118357 RepID=A0A834GPV7_RHOSS|nr:hypothetical protein RHSIM_Rhsim07G0248400 [Rhododendron simsii]
MVNLLVLEEAGGFHVGGGINPDNALSYIEDKLQQSASFQIELLTKFPSKLDEDIRVRIPAYEPPQPDQAAVRFLQSTTAITTATIIKSIWGLYLHLSPGLIMDCASNVEFGSTLALTYARLDFFTKSFMVLTLDLQDFLLRALVLKLYRQALRIARRGLCHARGSF